MQGKNQSFSNNNNNGAGHKFDAGFEDSQNRNGNDGVASWGNQGS